MDELTPEQQIKVINLWNANSDNPPSMPTLLKEVFGTESPDGKRGKMSAIRRFIASRQLAGTSGFEKQPLPSVELTQEQKDLAQTLCANMSPVEIARLAFKNPKLGNTDLQTKAINTYLREIGKENAFVDPSTDIFEEYKAPKTLEQVVYRVNKYMHDVNLDAKLLNPRQKKEMGRLEQYLHDFRYLHQINTYKTVRDRELFESEFIKFTYDKGDLTNEDLDQYIIFCTEVVISSNIQRTINMLQEEQDKIVQSSGKMSMAHVQMIKDARDEYNASVERQQKLFKSLTQERSKRLSAAINENATILNLVSTWKTEEERVKYIKYAELRKQKLSETIDEISQFEDMIARVFGLSKDEVLNE